MKAINALAAGGMHFWDYGNAFLLEASKAGVHVRACVCVCHEQPYSSAHALQVQLWTSKELHLVCLPTPPMYRTSWGEREHRAVW